MANNTCPICEEKTSGRPVRQLHFCKFHRSMTLSYLETDEGKKDERQGDKFIISMKRIAFHVEAQMRQHELVRTD